MKEDHTSRARSGGAFQESSETPASEARAAPICPVLTLASPSAAPGPASSGWKKRKIPFEVTISTVSSLPVPARNSSRRSAAFFAISSGSGDQPAERTLEMWQKGDEQRLVAAAIDEDAGAVVAAGGKVLS